MDKESKKEELRQLFTYNPNLVNEVYEMCMSGIQWEMKQRNIHSYKRFQKHEGYLEIMELTFMRAFNSFFEKYMPGITYIDLNMVNDFMTWAIVVNPVRCMVNDTIES